MLNAGVAEKHWTKEGVFYIKMLIPVGEEVQNMALSIDPGSKFDGYAVSGEREVALLGMAVLPSNIQKRMETRKMLRRNRRYKKCRRREARFDNRKRKDGWIAPSQLAKVQLRIRLMERLCKVYPITDIVIEDVKFDHFHKRYGKYFSTVEIGKTKVYDAAKKLGNLWLPMGWDTAQARKDYGIKKCSQKSKIVPESHANDAWAMLCWLYGFKSDNTTEDFYIWRRQEYSRRQLHLQNPSIGNKRKKYGGTTNKNSTFRKGDVINYRDRTIGYVGGWTDNGNTICLVGTDGNRIRQASKNTIKKLSCSPNILYERRIAHSSP